jgi:hypothetical protein
MTKSASGTLLRTLRKDVQQKLDVLLVRDAADIEQRAAAPPAAHARRESARRRRDLEAMRRKSPWE